MLIYDDILSYGPSIPAASVDLILVDFPYGIGDSKLVSKKKNWKKSSESWDQFESVDAQYAFYRDVYDILWPSLKSTGVVVTFGSYHNIYLCGELLQRRMAAHTVNSVVWYKSNAMFSVTCSTLIESTEHMIVSGKSKDFYFNYEKSKTFAQGKQLRNVWESPLTNNAERSGHPHQKPLFLYSRLIDIFCPPNGFVLDPMCGSGTTGVVCEAKGLKYLCVEKSDKYHGMAKKRIDREARVSSAERSMFGDVSEQEEVPLS